MEWYLTGSELSWHLTEYFNISCNGGNDGSIKLTISGGSGNYAFLWSGPDSFAATTKDISGLRAGNYVCTVTDVNGCILTPLPPFTLTEPPPINIVSALSASTDGAYNINCFGGTGSVSITVTGGIPGTYQYTLEHCRRIRHYCRTEGSAFTYCGFLSSESY